MRGLAGLLVALVAVVAGLTGCSAHTDSGAQPSPSHATPSVGGIADERPSVRTTARLSCADPIDGDRVAPAYTQTAGGAVALLRRMPQLWVQPRAASPFRRATKVFLEVRAGRAATVSVPASWADRVAFTWGTQADKAPWTTELSIPRCPAGWRHRPWIAFPGSISLDQPACVPFRITTHGRTSVIPMAIGGGVSCPRKA